MNITRGSSPMAVKCCLYGAEGIGKSTLASQFPAPIFIDTEGSTKYLDVDRFDRPSSWEMLKAQVQYIRDNPNMYQTLVIDTADWAEKLCMEHICAKNNFKSIESPGYGRGYTYLQEEFGTLLNQLTEVTDRGVNVVVVAHAMMRKFELPDEQGAYDRWELKLTKKVAPLVKEWADMIFFCNYRTVLIEDAKTRTLKAHGGERVLYTSHHNCWDAKCRANLPPMLPMAWESIAPVIPHAMPAQTQQPPMRQEPPAINAAPPMTAAQPANQTVTAAPTPPPADPELAAMVEAGGIVEDDTDPGWTMNPPVGASPALLKLYDLMKASEIYPAEVEAAVYERGYYPAGVQLAQMDPEFVNGCLVAGWKQVKQMILQNRAN